MPGAGAGVLSIVERRLESFSLSDGEEAGAVLGLMRGGAFLTGIWTRDRAGTGGGAFVGFLAGAGAGGGAGFFGFGRTFLTGLATGGGEGMSRVATSFTDRGTSSMKNFSRGPGKKKRAAASRR